MYKNRQKMLLFLDVHKLKMSLDGPGKLDLFPAGLQYSEGIIHRSLRLS